METSSSRSAPVRNGLSFVSMEYHGEDEKQVRARGNRKFSAQRSRRDIPAFQLFQASTTAPATISTPPIKCCGGHLFLQENRREAITKITLSLSTGATLEASPSCRARK